MPTSEHFNGCQYVISKRFYSQGFYGFYIPSKLLQVTIEQLNFGLLSIPKKGKMKAMVTCTSAPKIILKTKAWTFSLNWLTDVSSSFTQAAPLLYIEAKGQLQVQQLVWLGMEWLVENPNSTICSCICLAWNGVVSRES